MYAHLGTPHEPTTFKALPYTDADGQQRCGVHSQFLYLCLGVEEAQQLRDALTAALDTIALGGVERGATPELTS